MKSCDFYCKRHILAWIHVYWAILRQNRLGGGSDLQTWAEKKVGKFQTPIGMMAILSQASAQPVIVLPIPIPIQYCNINNPASCCGEPSHITWVLAGFSRSLLAFSHASMSTAHAVRRATAASASLATPMLLGLSSVIVLVAVGLYFYVLK